MATHFLAAVGVGLAVIFAVKGCHDVIEDSSKASNENNSSQSVSQPAQQEQRLDPCKYPPKITGRTPRLDELCLEPTPETPSR